MREHDELQNVVLWADQYDLYRHAGAASDRSVQTKQSQYHGDSFPEEAGRIDSRILFAGYSGMDLQRCDLLAGSQYRKLFGYGVLCPADPDMFCVDGLYLLSNGQA